ncbi:MAG: alternative ribosome rescue aminoacyl-tRNA hydrolase ArfB [Pseudomonadota bacterium]
MRINDRVELADWELIEQFSRASGPGGQNVNKVATAVTLRFEAMRSPHLSEAVKRRLKRLAGRRWTTDGAVVIQASDTRSQAQNRTLARKRLADLVAHALETPKKRVATKIPLSEKRRRLRVKRARATVKAGRSRVNEDEE